MILQEILNTLLASKASGLAGKKVLLVVMTDDDADFATNMPVSLLHEVSLSIADATQEAAKRYFVEC